MKANSFFHTLLEIVVVLGFIAIGVTALTYVIQPGAVIDKTFISLIILASGACSVLEFLSLKSLAKLRNIPNLIASILYMALGVVLLVLNIETELVCILWGSITIGIQAIKIANDAFNITQKPLMLGIKIILSLVEIVFCVILIARKESAVNSHIVFIGVALLIEASLCLIHLFMERH